jgi:hypothetical protein
VALCGTRIAFGHSAMGLMPEDHRTGLATGLDPHRFRDTFAVSLLLPGHGSIKVTERHYAPWVKARQELLESEVRRIWAVDQATK